MDSVITIYLSNKRHLMIDYWKPFICIGRFTSNNVFLGQDKIKLCFFPKNRCKSFVLNLFNIFYLLNIFCNLVKFAHLNNSEIFYNNKNKISITSKLIKYQYKLQSRIIVTCCISQISITLQFNLLIYLWIPTNGHKVFSKPLAQINIWVT